MHLLQLLPRTHAPEVFGLAFTYALVWLLGAEKQPCRVSAVFHLSPEEVASSAAYISWLSHLPGKQAGSARPGVWHVKPWVSERAALGQFWLHDAGWRSAGTCHVNMLPTSVYLIMTLQRCAGLAHMWGLRDGPACCSKAAGQVELCSANRLPSASSTRLQYSKQTCGVYRAL